MKRRGFLGAMVYGAMGGIGASVAQGKGASVRYVEFSPPGERPAIHWMTGHRSGKWLNLFHQTLGEILGRPIPLSQIKFGWASKKLSGVGIYLSDTPQPHLEPITYWIPSDYTDKEIA